MPILKDRYEFEPNNRAGKGGFGSVYKAKDLRFDRWVALKFADKVVGQGKQEKYSLFEEAKRAIRLRHRCLAEYIDAEIIETQDPVFGKRTDVFVVMEWIEGVSLTEFFQQEKPALTIQLELLNQILRGLRYLHEHGFIHRDLTPNNIMVTKERNQWQIKIIDLGISKNIKEGSSSASVLVGTPNYMSPEQFDAEEYGINGKVSYNSDLWSLGIIWYELLTGQLPFASNKQDSTGQIIQQILQAPLQIKTQHLDKVYQLFFERVLLRDSKKRIGTAIELMDLLKQDEKQQPKEEPKEEEKQEENKRQATKEFFETSKESITQPIRKEEYRKEPKREEQKIVKDKSTEPNFFQQNKKAIGISLLLMLLLISLIVWSPWKKTVAPIVAATDSADASVADSINETEKQQWKQDSIAAAIEKARQDSIAKVEAAAAGNNVVPSEQKPKQEQVTKAKTIAYGSMRDREGQVYRTVKIGKQEWMAENLTVSTFRNGDLIPQATTDAEWEAAGKAQQPAWCYYENSESNGRKYGKLYNWYAVSDPRGLAPAGWVVPATDETGQLHELLGNLGDRKLKSKSGWNKNGNGTDMYGFSGLPGGCRSKTGVFNSLGSYGYWWCADNRDGDINTYTIRLTYDESSWIASSLVFNKMNGYSVRCLRD